MYKSARVTLEFRTETGTVTVMADAGRGPNEFAEVGQHLGAAIQKALDEGLLKPASLGSRQMIELQAKLNETTHKLNAAEQQLQAYTVTSKPKEPDRTQAPDASSSIPGVQSVVRKSRRSNDRE